MPETLESLWTYCTDSGRLVPMPKRWNELYQMLPCKIQKPAGGWEPPLPLILAAWADTIPISKRMRFREHLEWAAAHGNLDEVGAFLRTLSESEWCHFGEV